MVRGPRRDRRPSRRTASNAARPRRDSTDILGATGRVAPGSGRQATAATLAAGTKDGSATAGRHAVAEPVPAGPAAGVGLIGALHCCSSCERRAHGALATESRRGRLPLPTHLAQRAGAAGALADQARGNTRLSQSAGELHLRDRAGWAPSVVADRRILRRDQGKFVPVDPLWTRWYRARTTSVASHCRLGATASPHAAGVAGTGIRPGHLAAVWSSLSTLCGCTCGQNGRSGGIGAGGGCATPVEVVRRRRTRTCL